MVRVVQVDNVRDGYADIVEMVYRHGDIVSPREKPTFEIQGLTVISMDPTINVIVDDEEFSEFIDSEIDTVTSGKPAEVKASAELIERLDLQDDGTFFESGIRKAISTHWDHWFDVLYNHDKSSRKIAAVFSDPEDDDLPCTVFLQFLYRSGELDLYTLNRSQDLLWGYPADMQLFETLQCRLASRLGVSTGLHWHTMISAHWYEEQWDEAKELWS